MLSLSNYRLLLITALLGLAVFSGCEREPVTDQPSDAHAFASEFRDNVVRLDTLIFSNPFRTNGNVRFDLIGSAPEIKPGDVVFYPGSDALYGKVVAVTPVGSRIVLELAPVGLDEVFANVSVIDTIGLTRLKLQTRTDAGLWNGDTLNLDGTFLFDDFWEQRFLKVQFTKGRLYSNSSAGRFVVAGQGSDPWFDRCRLDFTYDIDFSGDLLVQTGSAMDATDSLLVKRSVYGPFLVNGFPVTYQVETWLGFHIVTQRDTVLSLNWSGVSRGNLSVTYNYWETWQFKQQKQIQSADIQQFTGPMFSGYRTELFISQVITPMFSGVPSFSLANRLSSLIETHVTIPDWESDQTISTIGTLAVPGEVLREFMPTGMSTGVSLLYQESQTVTLQNQRPVASFIVDPGAGFTDTNFKFDASGCTDMETPAESLMVRWDFDGDNHFDTEFSTDKVAFFKYPVPGIYNLILEVQDEKGLTERESRSLEVSISTSAPIAHFSVIPESGRTSDIFIFDAYLSYDAEDNVNQLKIRWDFDGDSVWDTSWSTKKIEYFVFREEGRYVAKLEVLDTQGLTGSTTRIVTVIGANIKPTAFFTVDPASGTTETRFNFDASGSSDPEDPAASLQVRWDWENDGIYDTDYRTVKTIQHVFPTSGKYTIVMEVIDSEGYGSTYAVDVEVTNPNTPPVADFTISPSTGYVGMEISFDASACTDAEDLTEELEVRWDWNYDNIYDTPFIKQKVLRRSFEGTGTFIIKMEVRDSGGLTDTRVRLLTIE